MIQKVIRTGHSLAVVIPSNLVKVMGLKAGDKVKITGQTEKGKIILSFFGILQLPLSLGNKNKSS